MGGEYGRVGVDRMEWSEGGGEWDNCNSIINKYIKKIKLQPPTQSKAKKKRKKKKFSYIKT